MGMKQKSCLAAFGLVAVTAGPVMAAESAGSASELEVITVTAQKRAESEQTVPLSMTTFGAAALEQKAIATFFDYGTKVPNLAFAPTGDGVGTSRTISIRGISGDNVTGFYLDETPLPDSIDPRVLDIDHIEVLRGPQGTLYGARSMGGTVRVITKAPNLNGFEATVHGGFSKTSQTGDPNYTADGVVNIPLIQDRLAARVSAFYDRQAGYFKRSFCTDPATAGVDAGGVEGAATGEQHAHRQQRTFMGTGAPIDRFQMRHQTRQHLCVGQRSQERLAKLDPPPGCG